MEAYQQVITIPLLSNIDMSDLLEIAQELLEDLQDRIEDKGCRCQVDEEDVSVESTQPTSVPTTDPLPRYWGCAWDRGAHEPHCVETLKKNF